MSVSPKYSSLNRGLVPQNWHMARRGKKPKSNGGRTTRRVDYLGRLERIYCSRDTDEDYEIMNAELSFDKPLCVLNLGIMSYPNSNYRDVKIHADRFHFNVGEREVSLQEFQELALVIGRTSHKSPKRNLQSQSRHVRAKKENNVRTATTRKIWSAASANHSTPPSNPGSAPSPSTGASFPRSRGQHSPRPRHPSRRNPHQRRTPPDGARPTNCSQAGKHRRQPTSRRHSPLRQLELTKQIGDLALKLHAGRSRNEQIATDMRLFIRAAIDDTLEASTNGARAYRSRRGTS